MNARPSYIPDFRQLERDTGYRVIRTLAQSDRSAVYLARSSNAELDSEVALKVLRRSFDTPEAHKDLERFQREYMIIGRLSHRAIVGVYDFGNTDNLSYIATEYFPAGDLHVRLRNPVTIDDAIAYIRQIAEALRVVHEAGVLHRDLKPANVMLRLDNTPVLIDFGLAKSLASDHALTGAGEIRGSPYYMSPEQTEGKELDARSDLYSLGVIFFELLTGRRPYNGTNVFEILGQHQHGTVPRLPEDAKEFQPLIDRLLAKSPAGRFQSADEFLLAFSRL